MKIKISEDIIKKLLSESPLNSNDLDTKIDMFINNKPEWANLRSIPNVEIIDSKDIIKKQGEWCESNKCETNAYNYIKHQDGEDFALVGGFMAQSAGMVEHYWIYNLKTNEHIEVSPVDSDKIMFYVGIIFPQATEKIKLSKNPWDIYELKGGNVYFKYFNPYQN